MPLKRQLACLALLLVALPVSSLWLFRSLELTWRNATESSLLDLASQSARLIHLQNQDLPGNTWLPAWNNQPLQLDGYAFDWSPAPFPQPRSLQSPDGQLLWLNARVEKSTLWLWLDWSAPEAGSGEHPDTPIRLRTANGGRIDWSPAQPASHGFFPDGNAWRAVWHLEGSSSQVEVHLPLASLSSGFSVCLDTAATESACWLGRPDQPLYPLPAPERLRQQTQALVPEGHRVQLYDAQGQARLEVDRSSEQEAHTLTSIWQLLTGALAEKLVPPDNTGGIQWTLRADSQQTRVAAEVRIPPDGAAGNPQAPLWHTLIWERTVSRLSEDANSSLGNSLGLVMAVTLLLLLTGLLWATWITRRLLRLKTGMEQSLSAETRYQQPFQADQSGDEIGSISRSFASLLEDLRAYAAYKESFVAKLTHECRTPVSIIRSSLGLMQQSNSAEEQSVYRERAEAACTRLSRLIQAMGEVTRLERLIEQYDKERVPLRRVLEPLGEHLANLAAPRPVCCQLPQHEVWIQGQPDLIIQALEKLWDNALSFTPPNGRMSLSLSVSEHHATLSVFNEGPALPETEQESLFEPYQSQREGNSDPDTLHLGLGLSIVRMVAAFHGAEASLRNVEDGVEASLIFPLVPSAG